jgi:hypothetical protein
MKPIQLLKLLSTLKTKPVGAATAFETANHPESDAGKPTKNEKANHPENKSGERTHFTRKMLPSETTYTLNSKEHPEQ